MPVPVEFTPDAVKAKSAKQDQLFNNIDGLFEPFKSMHENNPWMRAPDYRKPLVWGPSPQYGYERYWDTTVARKHEYWKNYDLPRPTKDIVQLRADLSKWGFCLIEDGLSHAQYTHMRQRLLEQADGERAAGVPTNTLTGQYIHGLINKGECFGKCLEQDPEFVQAGPIIEQLLHESLGKGWIANSFLANGCDPGGYPQGFHQDTNGDFGPYRSHWQAPTLFNTAYVMEDVNEINGGTLIIPGSHRILAAARDSPVGKLPPPINLEAKGGTVIMWDGRLLHAAGANRGTARRYVCTASSVKPWFRTQEQWLVSVRPDLLAKATPKLLHRLGFQGSGPHGTVEGFGIGGTARIGDMGGCLRLFRQALEEGRYKRVQELSPNMSPADLQQDFTIREGNRLMLAQREQQAAERRARKAAAPAAKL